MGVVGQILWSAVRAGTGYKAKILCSSLFVSRRDSAQILAEDLSADGFQVLRLFRHDIDREARRIRVSLAGFSSRTAYYRDGLGCTLSAAGSSPASEKLAAVDSGRRRGGATPRPLGERPRPASRSAWRFEPEALARAVAETFDEPDAERLRRTRALVVVHGGQIVAERYAKGIEPATPLLGWSMAKSVLALMVGALAERGLVDIEAMQLLDVWRGPGDRRAAITLDHLLRMSSGLEFGENYDDEMSDVVRMLFIEPDASAFAVQKDLAHAPASHWRYSSGSSNIGAAALRKFVAGELDYERLPTQLLFDPLGMGTAVMERDASGNLIASSFMYASARDWARLGQLLLDDGVWRGRRIIAEGWRDYMIKPTPGAPDQRYGAGVWLKLPRSADMGEPPMPEDAYYMLGHEQQIVAIVPSRDLVIVRLGLSRSEGAWDHARDLAAILNAFTR